MLADAKDHRGWLRPRAAAKLRRIVPPRLRVPVSAISAVAPRPKKKKTAPPCPITGDKARLVQRISTEFLIAMWRIVGRIDASDHYRGLTHIELYEADSGLFFFHPMIPGSGAFYRELYAKWHAHDRLGASVMGRQEYVRAASHVRPGDRVLDVGCGEGAFRAHLPHADFRGLDPYAPDSADDRVHRETAAEHAARVGPAYDVVTAFQVIEHVADPLTLAREMTSLARPGGLIVFAAPLQPSILSEVPNNLVNAPPHHLTWWNERAFAALAGRLGLEVVENNPIPPSPYQSLIFWARRLSPARVGRGGTPPFFAHRWGWHASMAAGFGLGWAADRLFGLPRNAPPVDAFFVGRKPGPAPA